MRDTPSWWSARRACPRSPESPGARVCSPVPVGLGCQTVGVRARELARPVPVVGPADDLTAAMRLVGADGTPGLVVAVGDSFVVVPASQVLRAPLPRYLLDDPALARVWDEGSADRLAERLEGLHVADLLAVLDVDPDAPAAVVDGDATGVEIAAVMAAAHVPLVAVVDDGRLVGAVTAVSLIARLTR